MSQNTHVKRQDRTIGDKVFAESVQAVVIHFDTQQTEALDGVKAWLPYLEELQPAIRLLTCNQCSATDTVSKDSCLHWCLDNDFELVELDPETESTDTEDDFPETVGIERIIEALEAHMWPNMVMKEQPASRSSYMQEMMLEHSDPADDSPPHSLTNRTKDSEFVLSDNVTPSDTKQCGDASLVDSWFLLATPTRQGDATSTEVLQNVTQESEACWDTTASSQRLSNVTEEQSVNITCHDSSKRGDSQHVGDTGVVTHDSSVQPDSCQRKKPPSCQSLKTKPADKQTLDVTDTRTMRLFEALASDDVEDDSYEQLFERLRIMKEKANTLPDTQRKAYAEQVAMSFLKGDWWR
ncbi:hypothetical protein LSAT2_010562 [Lamellibrachia satsuma]|nr:hypothetical protein LSAT2_010562 [Lamellibrachia satsuma]